MVGFSGGVIILLGLFSAVSFSEANFGIQEPYPENQYSIEHTSANVTCAAYDTSGLKVPERIQFVRKDQYADYTNITANDNIYFTNRTEDKGRKLFVTFHIRNVTMEDDSQLGSLGRYECHAYAVNDSVPQMHGFSISVLTQNEIPKVLVSKVNVLQHGDEARINCNITDRGRQTSKLQRISLFKDGEMLDTVKNPNPAESNDTLDTLIIKNAGVKDGGRYTCLLEVLLRNVKRYNVSDTTFVSIAPWFEREDENKTFLTGENVIFNCSARGFPLNVEWKVKRDNNETVHACVDSSTDKRYKIEPKGMNDPYFLSVTNLSTTDSGNYYCCLPSNCSANIGDRCQRFSLTVTDPVEPEEPSGTDEPSGGAMAFTTPTMLLAMAFIVASYLSL